MSYNTMHPSPASNDSRSDRQLRILTIVAMIPALALLIPSGVVTYQPLPAVGLVPMAMSAALGVSALGRWKMSIGHQTLADAIVAISLLLVLIPSVQWTIENERFSQICAYAMTPMVVNLCLHVHFFVLYLPYAFQSRSCPHCKHCTSTIPRWQHPVAPSHAIDAEEGQTCGVQSSASRAYVDVDARESSEYQTSGFGTPRQSVDTLDSLGRGPGEYSPEANRNSTCLL